MPTGLSFDPRTWLHPPVPPPTPAVDAGPALSRRSGEPPRARWLALGVSLALLAGGALAAWATREAAPIAAPGPGS